MIPIDLPDDGMRDLFATTTSQGVPVVCQHNPLLIARVVATKALRRTVGEANLRRFS